MLGNQGEVMKPRIIAFSGAQGAGKTTAAEFLRDNHGYKIRAFADPIYEILLEMDPIIFTGKSCICGKHSRLSELLEIDTIDDIKRRYPEVRRLLQKIGTEWGRAIHGPDCWVEYMMRSRPRLEYTVIPDIRFENEYLFTAANNGFLVHITNPRAVVVNPGHASEQFDTEMVAKYTIENSGTVEEFQAQLQELIHGV
jgi:hypothetical protein